MQALKDERTPTKISIITIVYNNVRDIGYTLSSVARQTYPYIEYIVVDGASTDGTLEVVQKYASRVNVLISEKDEGIYDAMNKGLARATGEYVLFLNSGDELYEDATVQKVVKKGRGADIIYGETKLIDEHRRVIGDRRHKAPKRFDWRSFRYGMNICHQAIYVRRAIAPAYDTRYQLSADIDWVINAAKKAKSAVHIGEYVAKYLVGGMSQQRHRQSLIERYQIFKKHYGTLPNLFNHFVIAIRLILYRMRYGNTRE